MIGGLHLMTKLFTVELEIFSDKKDIMMHDITINTVTIVGIMALWQLGRS